VEPLLIFVGTPRRRRYTSHLITSHRIAGINSISVCRTRRRPDACTSMIAPPRAANLVLICRLLLRRAAPTGRSPDHERPREQYRVRSYRRDPSSHSPPWPWASGCVRAWSSDKGERGTNGDLRGDPCFQLVLINCFSKGFGPLEMGFVFF
jgi:hypothetical protein